jgi:hypothetical protein
MTDGGDLHKEEVKPRVVRRVENTRRHHVRGRMGVLRDALCQIVGVNLDLGEIVHTLVGA